MMLRGSTTMKLVENNVDKNIQNFSFIHYSYSKNTDIIIMYYHHARYNVKLIMLSIMDCVCESNASKLVIT